MKTLAKLLVFFIMATLSLELAAGVSGIPPKLQELLTRIEAMKKEIASKEYKLSVLEALLAGGPEATVMIMPPVGEMVLYNNEPKVIDMPPVAASSGSAGVHESAPAKDAAPAEQASEISQTPAPQALLIGKDEYVEPQIQEIAEVPLVRNEPPAPQTAMEAVSAVERQAETTEISNKDSQEYWLSLRNGMTKKQVKSILGDPDKVSDRIIDYWSYITSLGTKGYVYFDGDRVTGWRAPYIGP